MSKRKPKTQTGFSSFSMHELAELITNVHVVSIKPDKPKQNELHNTRTNGTIHR
jgi:hypothetical protein